MRTGCAKIGAKVHIIILIKEETPNNLLFLKSSVGVGQDSTKKQECPQHTPEGISTLLAVHTKAETACLFGTDILTVAYDVGTIDVAISLFTSFT